MHHNSVIPYIMYICVYICTPPNIIYMKHKHSCTHSFAIYWPNKQTNMETRWKVWITIWSLCYLEYLQHYICFKHRQKMESITSSYLNFCSNYCKRVSTGISQNIFSKPEYKIVVLIQRLRRHSLRLLNNSVLSCWFTTVFLKYPHTHLAWKYFKSAENDAQEYHSHSETAKQCIFVYWLKLALHCQVEVTILPEFSLVMHSLRRGSLWQLS